MKIREGVYILKFIVGQDKEYGITTHRSLTIYLKHVDIIFNMRMLFLTSSCCIKYGDMVSNTKTYLIWSAIFLLSYYIMNIHKYGIKIVLQYIVHVYFICWNSFGYYYMYNFFHIINK